MYRHFPLASIHARAEGAAAAAECAARLGGNESFFEFADALFENQRRLGDELYESLATALGIDGGAFASCRKDAKIAGEVAGDYEEAVRNGGRGTPFVLILSEANGALFHFSGALPYESVKSVIARAKQN